MRDFLLLDEFASAWSEDRNESTESTRAEILQRFWGGQFERLGPGGSPGTILVVTDQNRGSFPDQCFTGIAFGREEFLTQVFMGPAPRPQWRQWSRIITDRTHNHDPGGYRFVEAYRAHPHPSLLKQGYVILRDCPINKYEYPSDVYIRSLGFPLRMLGCYFSERERNLPPFLVKAQSRLAGVGQKVSPEGKGRRAVTFDEERLRSWYSERVQERCWKDQHSSLAEDIAAARKEVHPALTERTVSNLRRELAPASWRKPGPRPSRKVPPDQI